MAAEQDKKYSRAEAKDLIDKLFGSSYMGRNEVTIAARLCFLRQDYPELSFDIIDELVADGWLIVKEFAVKHYERNL